MEVGESDLAKFGQIASEITSKIMQARSMLLASKAPSVLLHTKEMTYFLNKCASHAEAFLGDTQEQCDAFRMGVSSHQRVTLGRVRKRKPPKSAPAKKPTADRK
jgi:hypothetical protein